MGIITEVKKMKINGIISGTVEVSCGEISIMNQWGNDELDSLKEFEGKEVQLIVFIKE